MAGIRGGDGAMQNFERHDGTITHQDEDGVNSTPGFASNGTYFLRIEKVGDDYTCFRSEDGETFTEMFSYPASGIDADYIIIDAYTGMTQNYKFTLKSLKFEDVGGQPACEHDYVAVVTAPTCTEGGYTTYTCSKCGNSYVGDETAALGHDFGEWTVTKAATCTDKGEETRACSRCDVKETREIAATGHSFGEWTVTKAATCTAEGEETRACANCDAKETRAIAKIAHNFVDGKCTVCGEADPDYVPPVDYTALNEAIAAAEKVDGSKYTDASVEALAKALEAAKAAKNADTQAAVDAAKDALLKAIDDLELKPAPFRFDDVQNESDYFFDPVYWAVDKGITTGTSEKLFSPDAGCTRAQVVTFLWRAAGKPEPTSSVNPFDDVAEGQYYYKAVLWAVEKGITTGTSATTFRPERTCTRGQIVTFLWRYFGEPEPETTKNPFEDVPESQYYYKAILWAVENNITTGTTPTTFRPDNTCTRAQIVTFLYRAMKDAE